MCRTIGRAITRREALKQFGCYLPSEAEGFTIYSPEKRYYFLLD
jgi:hypothetical protein